MTTTSLAVPTVAGHDFNLPADLAGLGDLAYNLWWTWSPRAQALFSRINPSAWARHRNSIAVLRYTDQARWAELTADEDFMVDASRVLDEFNRYMSNGAESWYRRARIARCPARSPTSAPSTASTSRCRSTPAASACWPATTASPRPTPALPFIGIGLLYRRGYFRQQIDADGHQEHAQPDLDPAQLPLRRARGLDGAPLEVTVEVADRLVHAAVWVAQVGRVPILLLDTDIPANDKADRPITHILYVRGREMRLCQELVLGIGGVRALRALGIDPAVWHLNEGHSAFLLLERARELAGRRSEPRCPRGAPSRRSRRRLHDPHARAGRQRDVRA